MSSVTTSTILNRIENDAEYAKTYPTMIGKNQSLATQELHIFLADINPSEERVQYYYRVVNEWNDLHPGLTDKMKACYLALIFRDEKGNEKTVKVLQSARYLRSNSTEDTVKEAHADAEWFVKRGFSVIREKIEASAYGIENIPQSDEETKLYPTKYFEFHIKIGRQDASDAKALTDQELRNLKEISNIFTAKFGIPIPLSYNCNQDGVRGDGLGNQRFLNVRFRHMGMQTIKLKLDEINKAIESVGLRVIKTISEYVWYDSFTQLDWGWIDYSPDELKGLIQQIQEHKAGE